MIYFHAPGGGYIIFYNLIGHINSLWEMQLQAALQAIEFFININNFLFVTFIWAVICKYESTSWSLYLVFFILSQMLLISMASKE